MFAEGSRSQIFVNYQNRNVMVKNCLFESPYDEISYIFAFLAHVTSFDCERFGLIVSDALVADTYFIGIITPHQTMSLDIPKTNRTN